MHWGVFSSAASERQINWTDEVSINEGPTTLDQSGIHSQRCKLQHWTSFFQMDSITNFAPRSHRGRLTSFNLLKNWDPRTENFGQKTGIQSKLEFLFGKPHQYHEYRLEALGFAKMAHAKAKKNGSDRFGDVKLNEECGEGMH